VNAIENDLRAILAGRRGVRMAYLFGSAAQRRLRESSDLDVAVLFAERPALEELGELVDVLERASGRRVDLVDLGTASPLLLREIIMEGRLLWADTDAERIDFETRSLARYMDTAHLRRVQHAYLHDWAERYRAGKR
jgi:predicted nucleotidyltransferase